MDIEQVKAVCESPHLFTKETRKKAASEMIRLLDALAEQYELINSSYCKCVKPKPFQHNKAICQDCLEIILTGEEG